MSTTINGPDYPDIADAIGLTELRSANPTLTGAGVTVGQVEGDDGSTPNAPGIDFEVDPSSVGQVADNSDQFFTYYNGLEQTGTFNDGVVGARSSHASYVASFFYGNLPDTAGAPTGVAPDVAHVDNYAADLFLENLAAGALPDKVVNMSFLYTGTVSLDGSFDVAANAYDTVFVAAAGNSGTPGSPSSAYNVISVDSSATTLAVGPAGDGVPKPDISAPQSETSFAAPIVAGCATLLIEAARTELVAKASRDAQDFRAVKALLLNGATKPADYDTGPYAPTATQPLNAVYGAGVVNVFNAVQELTAGEDAAGARLSVASGRTAFAAGTVTPIAASEGWNLATLSAGRGQDAIDRYGFVLAAGTELKATLTWGARPDNTIDHLAIDLFDAARGVLVAQCAAPLSNVQQIDVSALPAGSYDLDVRLEGSANVSLSDAYALAFAETTSVACFATGTPLVTQRGLVAAERLLVGDLLRTQRGDLAPALWIGHRRIDCRRHPRPWDVQPVRVLADAFGSGVPAQDIRLSPDHAVFVGGVLIPVRYLLNGASVVQEDAAAVEYWHVELPRHEVVFAAGLPVESYLDTGNRAAFDNGGVLIQAHPVFGGAAEFAGRYAPLLAGGPEVVAAKAALLARLPALGFATTQDPDLWADADGERIRPLREADGTVRFRLPRGVRRLVLRSRWARPAEFDPASHDTRRLGFSVLALALSGVPLALHGARLTSGWHAPELGLRWTDGAGAIEAGGAREVALRPGPALRYLLSGPSRSRRTSGECSTVSMCIA